MAVHVILSLDKPSPTHIRDHYYDVTDWFDGTWADRCLVVHAAKCNADADFEDQKQFDFLILMDDGIYHAWGRTPINIMGQTWCALSKKEVAKLRKVECLFDHCDVWY